MIIIGIEYKNRYLKTITAEKVKDKEIIDPTCYYEVYGHFTRLTKNEKYDIIDELIVVDDNDIYSFKTFEYFSINPPAL
jgi:hypothetical protein